MACAPLSSSADLCHLIELWHAGTSVQHTGQHKSKDVFLRHILPVLEQRPSLWPGADYAAFEYAAGMVQSRSFRLNEENFLTGESVEGADSSLLAPSFDT